MSRNTLAPSLVYTLNFLVYAMTNMTREDDACRRKRYLAKKNGLLFWYPRNTLKSKKNNKRKNAHKKSEFTEFDVSLRINVVTSCPIILKLFSSTPQTQRYWLYSWRYKGNWIFICNSQTSEFLAKITENIFIF